ncbi:MAG: hypothetical protein AAB490_00415 [Patescibacteria group bacterium]
MKKQYFLLLFLVVLSAGCVQKKLTTTPLGNVSSNTNIQKGAQINTVPAGWTTYHSDEDGFTISFPNRFRFLERRTPESASRQTFFGVESQMTKQDVASGDIFLEIKANEWGHDLSGFVKDGSQWTRVSGVDSVTFKSDGMCGSSQCAIPSVNYVLKVGNKLYDVIFYNDQEMDATEQEILGTFTTTS